MKDKKILITGGAGAIGSNLAHRLSENNQVVILDDLSSGNIDNVYFNENVIFIRGDITIDSSLDDAFEYGVDIVFHLAAFFANQNSCEHPEVDLMTNGLGTLKLIRKAAKEKVEKFIYASSSCTVGAMPKTPYALTKHLGEQYVQLYQYYGLLPSVSLRYYNNYGPGEMPGQYRNVIPNFIDKALKGEDLVITGDGRETRDFTFVEDTVTASILAAKYDNNTGRNIDIGTGKPIKILYLAEKIIEFTNSKSRIVFRDKRKWDTIINRCCNTQSMEEILGFAPTTTLEEGLPITINWLKQRRT